MLMELPGKRRYQDGCATAHAMDLVGDRWALLVMRELLLGPRRFSDLKSALPGISANILAQRLADLETVAIVRRTVLPPPARTPVYELTEWGYESEDIFRVMGRWAARSPLLPGGPMSPASVVMSLRTMFAADRAGDLVATFSLMFGDEAFLGRIARGALTIDRGKAGGADVVFEGDPNALAGVLYGGVPLANMEGQGALSVRGDRRLAERLLTLFPLPEKAPAAARD